MTGSVELEVPQLTLDIVQTGWKPWGAVFKRDHYLPDAGPMAFSTAYTGFIEDEPVFFLGIAGMVIGKGRRVARVCRMVTRSEWQGAGVGMAGLEYIAERELRGEGFIGKPVPTIMHSAHPALAVSLRRNPKWRQISQALHGSAKSEPAGGGMGGHLRAVMGFMYGGQPYADAYTKEILPARKGRA